MTPLAEGPPLRGISGDAIPFLFACWGVTTAAPFDITGYAPGMSLRQNFGDPAPLIVLPGALGTIGLSVDPVTGITNSVSGLISGAGSASLPIMAGQRIAQFFLNTWIQLGSADPITLYAGPLFLRQRV